MSFARSASRSSADIGRGRSGFDLAQRMIAQVASAVATTSNRDWITEAPSGLCQHRTGRLNKPVFAIGGKLASALPSGDVVLPASEHHGAIRVSALNDLDRLVDGCGFNNLRPTQIRGRFGGASFGIAVDPVLAPQVFLAAF